MRVEPQQLKAFLLDADLVSEEKFEQALKKATKSQKKLGDILISDGLIAQSQLVKLEAYILGIPFVNLEKETVDPEILKIIPEPIARKNNIVAFQKRGRELEVAMLDPDDLRTIEFVQKKADLRILPRLTTPESIKNVLRQYQKTLEAEFGEIIKKDAGDIRAVKEDEDAEETVELEKIAQEMPVIRIVDTLIKHAVLERASDIHIEPHMKTMAVRFRIDGVMHDVLEIQKGLLELILTRIKILARMRTDEHRAAQDGRLEFEADGEKVDVRVSVVPVTEGEKSPMMALAAKTIEKEFMKYF